MSHPEPNNQSHSQQPASDFHEDAVLGGRYRIISLLGRGGMGVVYKVEQIFLGKELALKTIVKGEQTDFVLRRFQTEARAVFSLHHPNIIAVHDFGFLDDNTPFMAMEIINGKTLGDILKKRTLSVDEAISLFIQICFGLAHAHESGIVHRDIKPNNIMILDGLTWGTEGSIKILDFGIAKLTQHEGGEIQALTRTGEIFGSPFYMSPEQCLGSKVDFRSDIYSLGCVLFECLTGKPPFVGENAMNTMMMHQRSLCPTLTEAAPGKIFPPELEHILQAMLAKNPDDRYQNLGLTAHDLADLKRGEKSNISTVVSVPRPARPPVDAPDMVKVQKSSFALTLVATALICCISTGTIMQFKHSQEEARNKAAASKAIDPFEKSNLPSMNDPGSALKYARNLRQTDEEIKAESETQRIFDKPPVDSIANGVRAHASKFEASEYPTNKTLAVFKGYKNAQFVALSNCQVTDAGFKYLQDSKVLTLGLSGDKNVTSVDEISKLRYLQKLHLAETGITDSALTKLADLPMLEQLDLTNCNITAKGLVALTKSTSLAVVQLSDDKFPQDFIAKLQEKMPACTFRGYFDKSKMQTVIQRLGKTEPLSTLKVAETSYSLASQANPLSRAAATYSLLMAAQKAIINPYKDDRNQGIWKLVKRAEQISRARNDWQTLSMVLAGESNYKAIYGSQNEAVDLRERAIPLDVDTCMHDDRSLLKRIYEAIPGERAVNRFDKVIEFGKTGLKLVDQFPEKNQDYLPVFCEIIFWANFERGQPTKATEYARRNLDYWKKHQDDTISTDDKTAYHESPKFLYARALIEMAHAITDKKERKQYYIEALNLLDAHHWPEQINLCEHYCDACAQLSEIFAAEENKAEGLRYLNKAETVLHQMKHPDNANRKKHFESRIAQLNSKG